MTAEKWRVVVMMLFSVAAVSVGETLLSRGMRLTANDNATLLQSAAAAANRYVISGTLLMAVYFVLYMAALRLADLSFVLPLSGLSYLLGAILARSYLHEHVTPTRWLGAIIITVGVAVVGLGEKGVLRTP